MPVSLAVYILTYEIDTSPCEGVTYDAVETAFVGYCYGDSTSGQVNTLIRCENIYRAHLIAALSLQPGLDWYTNHECQ